MQLLFGLILYICYYSNTTQYKQEIVMKFNDFLKEEQLSIARFSKQTGLNEATVTKWKYNDVIPR